MKTSDYDYDLPRALIAQHPAPRRDEARLLVLRPGAGHLEHRRIRDLPGLLVPGDLLVANNVRVTPCRLPVRRADSGGRAEILFLEPVGADAWRALIRARRRPLPGTALRPESGRAEFVVRSLGERGEAVIGIAGPVPLPELLEREGRTPLPPYIKRAGPGEDPADRARYQTVYASRPGAVAAPTAGLHFTPALMAALRRRGVGFAELTLWVGPGTFRPVTCEDPGRHDMEAERFELPADTAARVAAARAAGRRIVAVGSTTVRTLETAARAAEGFRAGSGRTGLFIREPFDFRVTDAMLTNFHLPRSTLLMMVCAFAGRGRVLAAYREAVREGYRFFSYGDAMLILGKEHEAET